MILEKVVVGPLQTNCYLVGCETTRQGAVIDPGGSPEAIVKRVTQFDLDVVAVINTHGHVDHIMANGAVVTATGGSLMVHSLDAPMLSNPMRSFAFLVGRMKASPSPDRLLEDGDEVAVGEIVLKVLHTPGHSPGSISLLAEGQSVVFSGDALFQMGIGRTDFPGGDFDVLMRSIKDVLFALPDETAVYSGHGPATTIGRERLGNPWVR
jgi:glyoxylase-like metal-dependent hydrolase (beta-lactamase superfamily II)